MNQIQALDILKTGANVFLTGEPGTGKTYLINQYVSFLRTHGIEPAITASTGIAATHIGGLTIHSWSGIGIKQQLTRHELAKIAATEYIAKRIKRTKVLIIDEVSMLSPETLTMVNAVCREIKQRPEPFGNIQVVLVGDFFQLPPIIKNSESNQNQNILFTPPTGRFAYNAPIWDQAKMIVCYLTEQYRQNDNTFLNILGAIRYNKFNNDHLCHIEARKITSADAPMDVPKLFTHNIDVDRVNDERLATLPDRTQTFTMSAQGSNTLVVALKKGCLSPEQLNLKINAVVMFTKNSPKGLFVNGTLGIVERFDSTTKYPIVRTRTGQQIATEPMDWTVEENNKIKARLTQLPLRLAWAITIHKSQGLSLDTAVMDLSQVFEFGQGYVALSRVKRLSGLYILGWNERAFQVHPDILHKDNNFRTQSTVALQNLNKLSPNELKRLHHEFIYTTGGVIEPTNYTKSPAQKHHNTNTYTETLKLWRANKTISQIAIERNMTESTIFKHIEKLAAQNKIEEAEIYRLMSPDLVRALPKIKTAITEIQTDKLGPLFEELNGVYSYNDLRLAKILIRQQKFLS